VQFITLCLPSLESAKINKGLDQTNILLCHRKGWKYWTP